MIKTSPDIPNKLTPEDRFTNKLKQVLREMLQCMNGLEKRIAVLEKKNGIS